jgi:hypothetical protein
VTILGVFLFKKRRNMQTIIGEPIPILKPFEAEFIAQIWTPSQPCDKCMSLLFLDESTTISSEKGEVLINGASLEGWLDSQTTDNKLREYRKLLKTMVISALYGEDRYLKQKGE